VPSSGAAIVTQPSAITHVCHHHCRLIRLDKKERMTCGHSDSSAGSSGGSNRRRKRGKEGVTGEDDRRSRL